MRLSDSGRESFVRSTPLDHAGHRADPIRQRSDHRAAGAMDVSGRSIVISTYQPSDYASVRRLHAQGLLQGWVDPYDDMADLDAIEQAYLHDGRSHFWVARDRRRVIGMIAAVCHQPHIMEVRRLRVDRNWQHTRLAVDLIQVALDHCRRQGILKVVFNTHYHDDTVVELMGRHGFQFTRLRRGMGGKHVLEFYSNLYCRDDGEAAIAQP